MNILILVLLNWAIEFLLSFFMSWSPDSSPTKCILAWKTATLIAFITAKYSDLTLFHTINCTLFSFMLLYLFLASGGKPH